MCAAALPIFRAVNLQPLPVVFTTQAEQPTRSFCGICYTQVPIDNSDTLGCCKARFCRYWCRWPCTLSTVLSQVAQHVMQRSALQAAALFQPHGHLQTDVVLRPPPCASTQHHSPGGLPASTPAASMQAGPSTVLWHGHSTPCPLHCRTPTGWAQAQASLHMHAEPQPSWQPVLPTRWSLTLWGTAGPAWCGTCRARSRTGATP